MRSLAASVYAGLCHSDWCPGSADDQPAPQVIRADVIMAGGTPSGYLFLDRKSTASTLDDWQGGVDLTVMAAAERRCWRGTIVLSWIIIAENLEFSRRMRWQNCLSADNENPIGRVARFARHPSRFSLNRRQFSRIVTLLISSHRRTTITAMIPVQHRIGGNQIKQKTLFTNPKSISPRSHWRFWPRPSDLATLWQTLC